MLIYEYRYGQLEQMFTDRDTEYVDRMCRILDAPMNDITDYQTESGEAILFWRKDGKIHGNIFGHDERDIPESSIANGKRS